MKNAKTETRTTLKAYLKKRWREGNNDLPIEVAFGNIKASDSKHITERIANEAWRPDVPPELRHHWPRLVGLIERCWDHDPKARPTAQALADELALLEKDCADNPKDKLLGAHLAVGDREQLLEYNRLCALMDENDKEWQFEMDISLLDGKLKGTGRKGKDGVICMSLVGELNTSAEVWAEVNESFDETKLKYAGLNAVEISSKFSRLMYYLSDLPWPVGALQVYNREVYRLLDDGSYFHCAYPQHENENAINHPKLKTITDLLFVNCPRYYMIEPVRDPTSGKVLVGRCKARAIIVCTGKYVTLCLSVSLSLSGLLHPPSFSLISSLSSTCRHGKCNPRCGHENPFRHWGGPQESLRSVSQNLQGSRRRVCTARENTTTVTVGGTLHYTRFAYLEKDSHKTRDRLTICPYTLHIIFCIT